VLGDTWNEPDEGGELVVILILAEEPPQDNANAYSLCICNASLFNFNLNSLYDVTTTEIGPNDTDSKSTALSSMDHVAVQLDWVLMDPVILSILLTSKDDIAAESIDTTGLLLEATYRSTYVDEDLSSPSSTVSVIRQVLYT
jgi:hypothetical protein